MVMGKLDGNALKIGGPAQPRTKVLFLGYNQQQTRIIDHAIAKGCEVWHTESKIDSTEGYDRVISFGCRHILSRKVIDSSPAPIINLHISYLPWNRGAHPNFWSFFDGTPSGVTIHLIDEGVDTGPILFQQYVNFSADETTFAKTHKRLVREIEDLFVANIEAILFEKIRAKPQRRKGTFHRVADLPKEFAGWESEIESEIRRLDEVLGR